MRHDIYFVIAPNATLVSRLEEMDTGEMSDLRDPVMWSGFEFDKGGLAEKGLDRLIKLLFLDVLRREQISEPRFHDIFDGLQISEAYFDLLWTIQRPPLDMSVDIAIADALASGTIDEIESAGGDAIGSYLVNYRKRFTTRKNSGEG